MAEGIEATSLVWKQIADTWNTYFTPPSRISPEEIEKYREWLKQLKAKQPMKALVLGATPELRDALNELGYEVITIDINLEMIMAMNSLLKIKNPNEILIRANWLNSPLQSGYFDMIVGDAVLPNIPWKERGKLLSEVRRMLKPSGAFITRSFCAPRKKPFAGMNELFKAFSEKEPNYKSALELVLELQILAYNPKDRLGTFSEPKRMLETVRGKNGFDLGSEKLNRILDIVWNFWCTKFADKVFVYAYRDEEEDAYRQFFEIMETFEADDNPYSKITPMYILKPKP